MSVYYKCITFAGGMLSKYADKNKWPEEDEAFI